MSSLALITKSKAMRLLATQATDGIRRFKKPDDGGFLGAIIKVGRDLIGGLWDGVNMLLSWLPGAATLIWGGIVQATNEIINFDFNTTDEAIDKSIQAFQDRWYEQLGETLGGLVGWSIGGLLPSLVLFKFNPVWGLSVLANVGEEMYDELVGEVSVLARMTAQAWIREQGLRLFMGARAYIKRMAEESDGSIIGDDIQAIADAFPWIKRAAKNWGEKGTKPWIIAREIEEKIESIGNSSLRSLVEGFWDNLGDSVVEAGFVVAGGIDSFLAEQQIAKNLARGKERVIEIAYNRKDLKTTVVFAGAEELIKPQIVAHMNNYFALQKKDVGALLGGEPLANTITSPGLPYMRIIFSNNKTKKVKQTHIDIHNIDRTKVDDWGDLKAACGGINGYMWGDYWVKALLPDNNTIGCFAASEQEGIDLIEGLLKFSLSGDKEDNILWSRGGNIKKGSTKKYDSTYKTPRRQYPYEVLIVNQQRILNEENGRANRSGIYEKREAILPLWTEEKPSNWAEKINEIFTTPGANS